MVWYLWVVLFSVGYVWYGMVGAYGTGTPVSMLPTT